MLQDQTNSEKIGLLEPCNSECSFCFLNYTDVLVDSPLFKGLERREIGSIIRQVHHRVRSLARNEVLAVEGDKLHQLFIVLEGSVVGEMMDFEGNILRVEKMGASRAIATAFLFGEKGRLPVTVTALEPAKILLIEKQDLLSLFVVNRVVMKNFLDIISDRAQFLGQRIKILSLPGLKGKVAFYLLELMKKKGALSFRMPNSQQELADMFGTTRPSVGRVMRELHNEGYIRAQGKEIKILNRTGLSALLGS